MELDAHSRYILFEIKFRQSLRDLEHCLNCSQLSLQQFEIKIKHMDKTVLSIDSIRLAQWLGRIPSSLETSMRENKIIEKIMIIFWQQNSYMVIHSKVAGCLLSKSYPLPHCAAGSTVSFLLSSE